MPAHGNLAQYQSELAACPPDKIAAPEDGTVLYSDDSRRNRPRAEAFAAQETAAGRPACTLEQTENGGRLDREELYWDTAMPTPQADQIWRDTSVKFTQQALGNVQTFVVGAKEDSVFRSAELPAALQNPNVSSINGVSREELAEIYYQQKDPEACFNRICEAELGRDRQRSATDPVLAEDVAKRDKLYRDTLALQGRPIEQATCRRLQSSALVLANSADSCSD